METELKDADISIVENRIKKRNFLMYCVHRGKDTYLED